MIMASIEFTGKIPFRDVYFHNITRDEKGRKHSKSLGNSPEVIRVMDKYGTDALRFTLVYLAPQGTDVIFSKEMCEIGRNFANKLWNAARFLMIKKEQSEGNNRAYKPDLFDKWITSRLNSTISEFTKALGGYRINEASKALYDFIWRDYCDWYIEILKIKANEHPESAEKIFSDAIDIFESAVKLLNPVMPFITEELWQGIKERSENDSITISQMPELDESLISPSAESDVVVIQEITTAIRNLKTELKYGSNKGSIEIWATNKDDEMLIKDNVNYIFSLSKPESIMVILNDKFDNMQRQSWAFVVVGAFEIYLQRELLFDTDEEKKKLEEEMAKIRSFMESISKKLDNEGFVSKAPTAVIEGERKKLADQQEKLDKLTRQFESL